MYIKFLLKNYTVNKSIQ